MNGAIIVAVVEGSKIERLDRLGSPKPQNVARVDAVTRDRRVVRGASDFGIGNPAHTKVSLLIGECFRASTKLHRICNVWARDFPRISEAQPFVSDFLLPAVANHLIKNAELIPDAVAKGWHFDRRERIHETRREPSKAAVTEAGLFFLRGDFIEIIAKLAQRFLRHISDPEIEQIVLQMPTWQIFC